MDGADFWMLAGLLGLILAAALLGAAEAALLRVGRVRIEVATADGTRGAARLLGLLDDLPAVLNTVLLVVLLVQIGAATIVGALAARLSGSVAVTAASIVLTIVLFVYTEAIPKTYAVRNPERVALATAPALRTLTTVLRPVVRLLVWLADVQAPGAGIASPAAPTEDELRRLANEAAATGTIEETDRILIERAFQLGDRLVDEIMVPRPDVVSVSSTATVRAALEAAIAEGHRRVPVWKDDLDHIVGVVRLRDLARAAMASEEAPVTSVATPPLVVPQSNRVVDVLARMQADGRHFAVVVDEHGGTEGIVTIEDVVSEILGQVADEGAVPIPGIAEDGQDNWIVSGSADVVEVAEAIDTDLPVGDWNTAAGLVIGVAGRIPAVGEAIGLDGLTFEILEASRNRIVLLRISRTMPGVQG